MKLLFAALALIFATQSAFADRILKLDFDGEYYYNDFTLKLKNEIKDRYPNIKLNRFELTAIRVFAKTDDVAEVRLRVGNWRSPFQEVDSLDFEFDEDTNFSYDNLLFRNNKGNSKGNWQAIIRTDSMRLDRVIVYLEGNGGGGGGPVGKTTIDTIDAGGFLSTTKRYRPDPNKVWKTMEVECEFGKFDVNDFEIEFMNGEKKEFRELEGGLDGGERKILQLNNRRIRSIRVKLVAPFPFGSSRMIISGRHR